MADELLDRVPVARPDPAADARADRDGDRLQRERLDERGLDAPLGCADLVLVVDVGEHDRELVAAEPRDFVGFAADAAQPRGGLADQLVAGLVAVQVVDPLELVEVDEQQPDCACVVAGAVRARCRCTA